MQNGHTQIRTITYSLKNNAENSDPYYYDVSSLTDSILQKSYDKLKIIIDDYNSVIEFHELEEPREYEEYLFDLLNTGTIWLIYNKEALSLSYPEYFVLSNLYKLRRKYKKLKPAIDRIRGLIGTYSLRKIPVKNNGTSLLVTLKKLKKWMEATGEFREDVKRINLLETFLSKLPKDTAEDYIKKIIEFAGWFETEANQYLKQYTYNVEWYLRNDYKKRLWKEDVIFCGRKETEYHLSMAGAELMNRAFRNRFNGTNRKAVLLPACMKLHSDNKCKARKISLDYICTGCSPKCNINKYTALGRELGYEVHIIPHSSDFTSWLNEFAVGKEIGVVGVACPLNLITGGLELKSLNIPAQCILTDYCGCKTHWDENGFPTDINFEQLSRIIEGDNKKAAVY